MFLSSVLMKHWNTSSTTGQKESLADWVKIIYMLDNLKVFTKSYKKILEPLLEASNKSFVLP